MPAVMIVLGVLAGIGVFTAAMGGALGWMTGSVNASARDNSQLRENLDRSLDEVVRLRTNITITQQRLAHNAKTDQNLYQETTVGYMSGPLWEASSGTVVQKINAKKRKSRRQKRSVGTTVWGTVSGNKTPIFIILVDDASSDNDDMNSTKYETRALESGVIAPNLGLVMEQTGSYLEYSGFIYVPIIYHMPHLIESGLAGSGEACNLTANPEHQKMIIKMLKEKIGTLVPQNRHRRQKRFIETLVVGGVAAWNRASIWSLEDTVSSLDKQISEMKAHNQIVVDSINTLIDNQHAIHHAVDRQARIFREFMERSTCAELVTNYFREIYSTWLAMAPNDFARVVDSALSGKITPDILPATYVISTLLKHPSMAETAYTRDMTFLYELGKLSLHQVNFEPYPMVSGVMIFPRILTDRSAALMKLYTTHLPAEDGFKKTPPPRHCSLQVQRQLLGDLPNRM